MTAFTTHYRRGMTLVELLVVVAVIGLLAVAVAPVLQPRPQRRAFQDSADILAGILTEASSKAIGTQRLSGVMIAAESVSGLVSPYAAYAAVHPRFARTAVAASGLTTAIIAVDQSVVPPQATIAPLLPSPPALGSLLLFAEQKKAFPVLNQNTIEMASGDSLENASFPFLSPAGTFLHDVELLAPPTPRMYAITPTLKGDSCIDLSCSSLGVEGYSTTVVPFFDTADPVQQFSVLFDTLGKPTVAWLWRTSGATERIELLDSQPLALMVGSRLMAGSSFVPTPTEDNPGWNYQNPNTFWVVLDPKAAVVRVIENNPSLNSIRATARAESQAFIADDLKQ